MKAIEYRANVNGGFTSLKDVEKYLVARKQMTRRNSDKLMEIIIRLFDEKKIRPLDQTEHPVTAKFILDHIHWSRLPASTPKYNFSMAPLGGSTHRPRQLPGKTLPVGQVPRRSFDSSETPTGGRKHGGRRLTYSDSSTDESDPDFSLRDIEDDFETDSSEQEFNFSSAMEE